MSKQNPIIKSHNTTKRKVFYYSTIADDVSFLAMLQKVGQLSQQDRVYVHKGQEVLFELNPKDNCVCGKITLLREEGVPSIGKRGSLTARPIDLDDNEGIQEATHFAFAPSHKLLAFEYNHFGPRIGLLFKAVNDLYRDHFVNDQANYKEAEWSYIQRDNAMDRINQSQGIKDVTIAYISGSSSVPDNSSLGNVLDEVAGMGNVKKVNISFKGEKGNRNPIISIKDFFTRILPEGEKSLPNFDKLKVKIINQTGGVEIIDLFEDKVVTDITVVKVGKSKQIDSQDLFDKMSADLSVKVNENL